MPIRARRISASTTNMMMMTIELSPFPLHLNKQPKLAIPNLSQQAVVGGKQLQQSPAPGPGPGQGVGT